jgi:hypothetical protein
MLICPIQNIFVLTKSLGEWELLETTNMPVGSLENFVNN